MFTYFSDLKSLFCEFMTENLPYNRDVVEYLSQKYNTAIIYKDSLEILFLIKSQIFV